MNSGDNVLRLNTDSTVAFTKHHFSYLYSVHTYCSDRYDHIITFVPNAVHVQTTNLTSTGSGSSPGHLHILQF